MKTYKTVRGLQNYLDKEKSKGKTIGLVPTMGALHMGHISLTDSAQLKNDLVVVSIFVNPTQFNNKEDLAKYPVVTDQDASLLKNAKVDVLFLPSVKQIYPDGSDYVVDIDLNGLDALMEGEFRPGHFEGVVQVVKRLVDIANPDHLYMGQKDFQQFTIIAHMIKKLKMKVKLEVVPIKRQENGLAMSSRNRRLTKKQLEESTILYETLLESKNKIKDKSPAQIIKWAMRKLKKNENFKPEYFLIADGNTLQSITDFNAHNYVVACTAVWSYGVRLIDNMILKRP